MKSLIEYMINEKPAYGLKIKSLKGSGFSKSDHLVARSSDIKKTMTDAGFKEASSMVSDSGTLQTTWKHSDGTIAKISHTGMDKHPIKLMKEDAPVSNVGGGQIAGIAPGEDPPVTRSKQKKIAALNKPNEKKFTAFVRKIMSQV